MALPEHVSPRLVENLVGPEAEWPIFTDAQVAWLEKAFPNRVIERHESIEDHIRYAGAVDLITILRSRVPGSVRTDLSLTDEEMDELEIIQASEALIKD
jgi:hypothetical protein